MSFSFLLGLTSCFLFVFYHSIIEYYNHIINLFLTFSDILLKKSFDSMNLNFLILDVIKLWGPRLLLLTMIESHTHKT